MPKDLLYTVLNYRLPSYQLLHNLFTIKDRLNKDARARDCHPRLDTGGKLLVVRSFAMSRCRLFIAVHLVQLKVIGIFKTAQDVEAQIAWLPAEGKPSNATQENYLSDSSVGKKNWSGIQPTD